MTQYEVAELLNVPHESIAAHMHEHLGGIEREPRDDLEMLRRILKRLDGVVGDLLLEPKGNYRSLGALVNQIRAIIETLAKIEGRLDDSIKIELHQTNTVMTQLTTFMLSKLCPVCAAEVATFLKELDLNLPVATVESEVVK